jgi:hypothetical protein
MSAKLENSFVLNSQPFQLGAEYMTFISVSGDKVQFENIITALYGLGPPLASSFRGY